MNTERIVQRGIGRKEAKECIDLIEGIAEGLSLQGTAAFWDSIREFLAEIVPKEPVVEAGGLVPMSDARAECFGLDRLMPFGKHKDQRICDVPLPYLDWLIEAPDEFKDELRQYLTNGKIADRLRIELEQDAPWNQT